MKVRNPSWLAAGSAGVVLALTLALGPSRAWAARPPRDRIPPTTPTNLQVSGVSDYSVTLSWNASTDNSGNFSYRLVSSAGVSAYVPQYYTSYTFTTNHAAGSTYSFYAYAVDAAGNRSANSNTVSATLLPEGTPPSAPVLSLTHVGPTHISVAWTAPPDAGPPVYYFLYWNGNAILTASQARSYTLFLVQPETTHTFTVQARDGRVRYSPLSAPLTVTTPPSDPNDTTPPTTPTNLWAGLFGDGSTEFELYWSPSADNVTPQAYIGYYVYLNGAWLTATAGSTHITDYAEFGENTIEVVAVDEAGNESAAGTTTLNAP